MKPDKGTQPEIEPDELLFTDKEGNPTQLQEVIYDGLDRDYSERYPALLRLMREGRPAQRLYACVMLASWGVPQGLGTLIEWADDPGSTPWAAEPVTYDRYYGVDSAFEMLADAIRVAGEIDGHDEIRAMRSDAARSLLGIYHRVYFARALMVALDLDRDLAVSVRGEISQAVSRAVTASHSRSMPFDMGVQAAFLLGPLAGLDDEQAARAAEDLLASHADSSRTVREVAYALGEGTGPATRVILERLAGSEVIAVRTDALDALARRKEA